jgi:hypothetical protein
MAAEAPNDRPKRARRSKQSAEESSSLASASLDIDVVRSDRPASRAPTPADDAAPEPRIDIPRADDNRAEQDDRPRKKRSRNRKRGRESRSRDDEDGVATADDDDAPEPRSEFDADDERDGGDLDLRTDAPSDGGREDHRDDREDGDRDDAGGPRRSRKRGRRRRGGREERGPDERGRTERDRDERSLSGRDREESRRDERGRSGRDRGDQGRGDRGREEPAHHDNRRDRGGNPRQGRHDAERPAATLPARQRVAIFLDAGELTSAAEDREVSYGHLRRTVTGTRVPIRAIAYHTPKQKALAPGLQHGGFEVVAVESKSATQIAIAVDAMGLADRVDCVVIIPGSNALAHLVRTLRARGVRVESASFDETGELKLGVQEHRTVGDDSSYTV